MKRPIWIVERTESTFSGALRLLGGGITPSPLPSLTCRRASPLDLAVMELERCLTPKCPCWTPKDVEIVFKLTRFSGGLALWKPVYTLDASWSDAQSMVGAIGIPVPEREDLASVSTGWRRFSFPTYPRDVKALLVTMHHELKLLVQHEVDEALVIADVRAFDPHEEGGVR